jgi:hypothetical protein
MGIHDTRRCLNIRLDGSMTRRLLIPVLLAAAVLPLTACFAPAPEPTPTEPPRPPSAAGDWVIERVITSTFPEAEADGATLGLEGTLYVLFTEEDCGETECAGSILSAATIEEREVDGAPGTYTNDESSISYTFETTFWSDCSLDDGTVIAADAYFHDIVYTVTATDVVDGEIVAFEGEGVRTYGMSDEAVEADCAPFLGDIVYELTGVKSD